MTIPEIVSNVGFPIVCCIYMGVYLQKTLGIMANAIENNTQAIRELREELRGERMKNGRDRKRNTAECD